MRLVLALLAVLATTTTARAQGSEARSPLRSLAAGQDKPVVELVTMGVGSLIWERHGHIALCVVYDDPSQDACYNYGIGSFDHPLQMVWGFFHGTHSFWVAKMDPGQMLGIYYYADRTIWVQPLPLTADQKQQVIAKLEHDILDDNKYYAYDHFWDNCTTRVRDIIDHATGGALSSMNEPTDGRTYRDLARAGFYGMEVPLLVTDIAMGRATDRVPSYYERMFLPDYLREAVQTKWHVEPIAIYTRRGPPPLSDGPSGRPWLALLILVITAPAWMFRRLRQRQGKHRLERAGLWFALVPQLLLGAVLWFLAIISPLPYVRWNESCLVLLPLDILLVAFLPGPRRRSYARGRVVMLALIAALRLIGVLEQPLWPLLLWPLVPCLVVGFLPEPPPPEGRPKKK
ncbi:MAG TPA: DUF4105 domain-containing protein [Kofleriaceae bacterium]|nr:DUF4105 domain-containing protein [Kofleriaceae bacterium]